MVSINLHKVEGPTGRGRREGKINALLPPKNVAFPCCSRLVNCIFTKHVSPKVPLVVEITLALQHLREIVQYLSEIVQYSWEIA